MKGADLAVIGGVWIRSRPKFDGVEVLVEVAGEWRRVFSEPFVREGVVSHIVEPLGIVSAPCDRRRLKEKR